MDRLKSFISDLELNLEAAKRAGDKATVFQLSLALSYLKHALELLYKFLEKRD